MKINSFKKFVIGVVWKGIHSGSNTNRTGVESLFFILSQAAALTDQMLAAMVLCQHRILSSKIINHMLHVVPDVWGIVLERGL